MLSQQKCKPACQQIALSPEALAAGLLQVKRRLSLLISGLKQSWYDFFRFCLFLIMFLILAGGIIYFFNREAIFAGRLPENISYDLSLPAIPLARQGPDASLLRLIDEKHIFTGPIEKPVELAEDERLKLQDKFAKLRLAGIILDSPPKAIIEYSEGKKTFYLSEGESFLGGIRVDNIKRGLVLLDICGQTFELYL